MRFYDVSEVPEKSVFTRLFCIFATAMLANFQDHLVMTASITLRVLKLTAKSVNTKYSIVKTARKLRERLLAKCKVNR